MTSGKFFGLSVVMTLSACGGDDASLDADADTDTDSDTDSGSDADSDSDSDTGTGTSESRVTLTVVVTGAGTGHVVSDVGGIDCTNAGGTCEAELDAGANVVLSATADEGFSFHGFYAGACTGGSDCTLAMDTDLEARASFVPILFDSARNLDGTDTADPDGINRLWTVHTDGSAAALLPGLDPTGSSYDGAWSPDGEWIAFNSDYSLTDPGDAPVHAWLAAADGSDAFALRDASEVTSFSPRWSADGSRVLYTANALPTLDDGVLDTYNIFLANADGSGRSALTSFEVAQAYFAAFSPDGTRVAFSCNAGDDGSDVEGAATNLWIVDVDGSGAEPLTHYTADVVVIVGSPAGFSPDGEWILVVSDAALDGSDVELPGASNVWKIAADGSEAIALTSYTSVVVETPSWSPDGTQVLFQSNGALDGSDDPLAQSNMNLWVVGADGSGLRHLTANTVAEHEEGAWSADGEHILEISDHTLDGAIGVNDNGTHNIFMMTADGRDPTPVTQLRADGADVRTPDW